MSDPGQPSASADLRDFVGPVWRRRWLLLAIVVLSTVATYTASDSSDRSVAEHDESFRRRLANRVDLGRRQRGRNGSDDAGPSHPGAFATSHRGRQEPVEFGRELGGAGGVGDSPACRGVELRDGDRGARLWAGGGGSRQCIRAGVHPLPQQSGAPRCGRRDRSNPFPARESAFAGIHQTTPRPDRGPARASIHASNSSVPDPPDRSRRCA